MYRTEIFFTLITVSIAILLLCQLVSVRIVLSENPYVTIEYFPIQIHLYNFKKMKIKKEKLLKRTRRLLFFLYPLSKSLSFLLKKAKIKIYKFSINGDFLKEPHDYFLSYELKSLIRLYLTSILDLTSKSVKFAPLSNDEESSDFSTFDFELHLRLYNILLTAFVMIFCSIKKKGKKSFVRK